MKPFRKMNKAARKRNRYKYVITEEGYKFIKQISPQQIRSALQLSNRADPEKGGN